MKTLTIVSTLALALALAIPGTAAEPNPEQSGTNGACEDFNALYLADGVSSPLTLVTVDGGSNYTLSHNGGAEVNVDFYNADGVWIGYSQGALSGKAPASAVYGTICVGQFMGWPTVPAPGATWTYQDGF